ncbi:MAG: hypothetical protein ACM3ZB_01570 [bacterium]
MFRFAAVPVLAFTTLGMCATPAAGESRPAVQEQKAPEEQPVETVELDAGRKELLKLIGQLQQKLPSELERKLIIISMKISTGWCSPHDAKEFEDEVNKLSPGQQRRFEKEWKLVREHKAWPTVAVKSEAKPEPAAPAK